MSHITQVLQAVEQGENSAERLLPLVYDELRKLAAAKMAHEAREHTLQPTALVHEAWMRLTAGDSEPQFQNRAHFFGAAAEAMRRILIERARRRMAAKRGSGAEKVDLDELQIPSPAASDEGLLQVNEALEKFSTVDPRKAELVKLRYFAGMTYEEAALALGIAVPTAKQWWAYARAWLSVEMNQKESTN